jgi:hypothetical protein
MAISRMQQPRQMYGLGSLVKKAVKGVTGGIKKIAGSKLGKAALIGAGMYGLGGGFGSLGSLVKGGISSLGLPGALSTPIEAFKGMGNFGKAATMFGIGSLGGGALAALEAAGVEDESQVRDTEALKAYLRQGYKQLNQDASPEQVEAFVTANTTEYAANGGRIGFADGMPREGIETLLPKPKPSEMMQGVDKTIQSIDNFAQLIAQSGSPSDMRGHMDLFSDFIQKNNVDAGPAFQYLKNRVKELKPGMERYIYISNEDMPVQKAMGGRINYEGGGSTDFEKWLEGKQKFDQGQNAEQLYREYLEDKRRQKVAEQKTMAANGGRIGFAFGNPEQNAINAAGIMNLPLHQNPAGVTELDLRETGGFIPPVGVKEKADDIPAMLSNNEFVFTAKSVKEMGNGDVEKGAQRMYDMMKKLEGGGRV